MTDKEMIEEMAKVLHDRIVNQTWRADKVAKELYEMVVPKGSVVLSRQEYEKLKADYEAICYNFDEIQRLWKTTNDRLGQCLMAYNITKDEKERLRENLQQARKETAREVLEAIKFFIEERNNPAGEDLEDVMIDGLIFTEVLDEIAKQYGVEVEE